MEGANPAKPRKSVGAVTQAFALLRVLSRTDEPQGVTALARAADVNPSTAFNILRTLVSENAVAFDERTKAYRLCFGLLDICTNLVTRSMAEEIQGDLQRIADNTNCLVGLWQATNANMQLVTRAVADSPMRLDMQVHHKLPSFAGALGRAWAAAQQFDEEKLRKGFGETRWEGPLDAERYVTEVGMARRAGYAIDEGALHPGIVTIASVIVDGEGRVTHGLSASDIAHRLDRSRLAELGEDLRTLAARFSG